MTTKVAIIGSGFGMYGLLPAFSLVKGCKVASICGKSSERMINYCKRLGVNRYGDWREMLQKENPDAVAIAVVPSHQYEIAKYALENGMAVFAEKPLTTSLDTSLELNKLAQKKNLPNMVDFIFPEIPEWHIVKKSIENGVIGKILNIDVDWKFLSYDLRNRIKSWKTDVKEGGGALSYYFSHTLYYLEYFIGKIKSMQCVFSASEKSMNGGETIISMILLFENGCIGNAHLNVSYEGQQTHTIEFHGEEGTILLQNNGDNLINFEAILNNRGGVRKLEPGKPFDSLYDSSEDPRVKPVKYIADRFINWCNTGNVSKPDFEDGFRVQELIEMAKDSNSKFWKFSIK